MEILGVGPSELIFVIIIAIIVLGPKDMQKAGLTIGRWLNQLMNSSGWKSIQTTSRALKDLPTQLMKDANMELWGAEQDLQNTIDPQRRKSIPSEQQRTSYKGPVPQKTGGDDAPPANETTRDEDSTTTND